VARIVVVGAGILGTMHAHRAVAAGHEVVHLDRDAEARTASVRNFGLCWVSGRRPGAELELALRARALWEQVGGEVPGVGFRPDGSMTVVQHAAELAVLEQVVARDDAAARGFELLEPADVRRVNPALRGDVLAGLHCRSDAVVEPRHALPAIRGALGASGRYRFAAARTVVDVDTGSVTDHTGERHRGDRVIVCTGAEAQGPLGALLEGAPLRRVRLQMCQTEPLGERLTTSLADGDSLRYYPCFDVPALASLPPQPDVAARYRMQLLVSQRATGALTIGDTHEYDEPFPFDLDEAPYDHLRERLASILGRPVPPVVRRWAGVYSQCTDGAICHRAEPLSGVVVVTGPGGRGMTLSPAIAEQTFATHPI
jgi:FAD dependent oxidoreductase TIGR03364